MAHFELIHDVVTPPDMSFCNQSTINEKAFENLRGIQTLNMSGCVSARNTQRDLPFCCYITDKAYENLRGIHTLDIMGCNQPAIVEI